MRVESPPLIRGKQAGQDRPHDWQSRGELATQVPGDHSFSITDADELLQRGIITRNLADVAAEKQRIVAGGADIEL